MADRNVLQELYADKANLEVEIYKAVYEFEDKYKRIVVDDIQIQRDLIGGPRIVVRMEVK